MSSLTAIYTPDETEIILSVVAKVLFRSFNLSVVGITVRTKVCDRNNCVPD